MGTRGYLGIKKKGQLKGMYNHYDSYPSGLGKDVIEELNHIAKKNRLQVLNETFDYIQFVDENSTPTQEQIDKCKEARVVDLSVSSRSEEDWYCLLRGTQGSLQVYIDKVIPYMINGNDFLQDSMYCEWGYVVNLDNNCLDVYQNGENLVLSMPLLQLDIEKLLALEEYEDC